MKKAILFFLAFVALQLVLSYAVNAVWMLVDPGSTPSKDPIALIVSMGIISLTTIILFVSQHWATPSGDYLRSRPWGVLTWCVLAAFGAIIPSMWLQELMPELPNLVETEMDMIIRNRWGYFIVGLLAPMAEELVFRGAVMRQLLASRISPLVAILVSALLFALIHANPAQMPHAFLSGLLLGWLYWRTGSIVPAVAYHWVNNTIAYVVYNIFPDPDIKLVELLGDQRHVLMAVGFSLCILLPALFQLNLRMKRVDEDRKV